MQTGKARGRSQVQMHDTSRQVCVFFSPFLYEVKLKFAQFESNGTSQMLGKFLGGFLLKDAQSDFVRGVHFI